MFAALYKYEDERKDTGPPKISDSAECRDQMLTEVQWWRGNAWWKTSLLHFMPKTQSQTAFSIGRRNRKLYVCRKKAVIFCTFQCSDKVGSAIVGRAILNMIRKAIIWRKVTLWVLQWAIFSGTNLFCCWLSLAVKLPVGNLCAYKKFFDFKLHWYHCLFFRGIPSAPLLSGFTSNSSSFFCSGCRVSDRWCSFRHLFPLQMYVWSHIGRRSDGCLK